MTVKSESAKKILIILPRDKFEEEEYECTRTVLSRASVDVFVASSQKTAIGINGTAVTAHLLIKEVNIKQFDAVVLIGGVGSIEYWHNHEVIDLIKKAKDNDKLIGAICLAPVTLANAGLLKNIKATSYNSAGKYLGWKGAIYTGQPIEISQKIITACGPETSREFAQAIVDSLSDL